MMLIEIKPDHLQKGWRQQCDLCPLALALSDATGDQWVVSRTHYWRTSNPGLLFALPYAAQAWIERYDARWMVMPVSFEMGVLAP